MPDTTRTKPSQPTLTFTTASPIHAPTLSHLINIAFASDTTTQAWAGTKRIDIISTDAVTKMMEGGITFIIATDSASTSTDSMLACCYIKPHTAKPHNSWLGLLCVDPSMHNEGLGAQMLNFAEGYVQKEFGAETLGIDVVSSRTELRAWYQRCGFVETGSRRPFPYDGTVEGMMQPGLEMVDMEKELSSQKIGKE